MGTAYAIPTSMDEFITEAKKRGWKDSKDDRGRYAMVSKNGHYCHYISETEGPSGLPWTTFDRFGGNTDVDELAGDLEAFSEYSAEFQALMGGEEGDPLMSAEECREHHGL